MSRFSAVLPLLFGSLAFGQTPAGPQFEVATVRPASADEIRAGSSGSTTGRGRAVMTNVTLKRCIMGAYGLGPQQVVGGPSWIDTDRFHIEAKAEKPTDDDAELDAMIRALLAERFHLAVHRDARNMQALVLVVGKQGPKLEKGDGGEAATDNGRGSLKIRNQTMDAFAERLSRQADFPVLNRTGLEGVFNLRLVWSPEGQARADAPSLFTAIQEQLGLRLESQKAPVPVLVVDHAEKPAEN